VSFKPRLASHLAFIRIWTVRYNFAGPEIYQQLLKSKE